MRLRVPLSLVIITLLALIILPAHAGTYVGFGAANLDGVVCPSNCDQNAAVTESIGEIVQAPFAGTLISVGLFTGSGVPNQVVILTGPTSLAITTYSGGSCGTNQCAFANNGQQFTIKDVETISGLTGSTFATINLANPVTVTSQQYVAIEFMKTTSSSPILMDVGTGSSPTVLDACFGYGTTNPVIGTNINTGAASCTRNSEDIVGGSFTSGATTGATTQCYGNCGSPVVTLANTNSTHSTNFNQSITLFYIIQSNLNGFVANVTVRVAKSYSNGETIAIGLYTADAVCTAHDLPFTPQCPGFLAQQQGPATNPSKGAYSMISSVAIQNGQWFGLAVTGAFQGLDLNDTNTNVVLSQASGQIPTIISQYSSLGNSKMALYAYVRGNSIITGPGGGQIPPGCGSVTCGILALWIALGGDVAAGIGAFLIVLGLIVGFLLYISRQHNPDGGIKGFAVPVELLGIIAVVVLIMFSAAGAIPAWIPGVIIFLVAGFFVAGLWGRRQHSNTVQG
jgi:hypothetical protein